MGASTQKFPGSVYARPWTVAGVPALRRSAAALVFAAALAWMAAGVEDDGIASAYCDPVSRIGAQDEAVYLRESIEMARGANWLTPTYLGRYVLNKPPLAQWLTALSLRAFGISAWSARIPSLVAAALIAAILFGWMVDAWSVGAALAGVLLLICSRLFYVFARLCVTDMLLTLWVVAAMRVLAANPGLASRRAALAFGALTGAGVMTKGAAGALPLLALGLAAFLSKRGQRPAPRRIALTLAAAALVAVPWHAYQLAVHPHWFVAEYILTQHLSIGVTAPPQYSPEGALVFYARRIFWTDPVLAACAALGLALAVREWRRHVVLLAWVAGAAAALIAFRYRSAYYLLPLLPAGILLAGVWLARLPRPAMIPVLALLVACGALKTASAESAWGLPAMRATAVPSSAALEKHCARGRANDLIVVDPEDQFYSSDLPFRRVRYYFTDHRSAAAHTRRPLDFEHLGIALPADEFNRGEAAIGTYRRRLAGFDMASTQAVGTVIWGSVAELAGVIALHPETDFLLRQALWIRTPPASHDVVKAGDGFVFFLSRMPGAAQAEWSCEL